MLRDKNLVQLSRQHQHALALCVRVDRASPIAEADLRAWQVEIAQQFEQEIKVHFAAEERIVFPAARRFAELLALVDELFAEHAQLREFFAQAEMQKLSPAGLTAFGAQLAAHIRKEERQLFERMQTLMDSGELAVLGSRLEVALKDAVQACNLENDTTKLRAAE